jgi:predicted dehydrogenase
MPAIKQCDDLTFAGIGAFTKAERFGNTEISDEEFSKIRNVELEKAKSFIDLYGGKIYDGYEAVVTAPDIDAVYIPLPPALHYKWAKKALESGKHVLVEKPATLSAHDTADLINIASAKSLAFHENYMFAFHNQLSEIDRIVETGEIGDVRLYRICFGFPKRAEGDFRYNKALGGGALIDAGGYTIKYATRLLGDTAEVKYAQLNYADGLDVDLYGSAALVNKDGVTAQIAFGMDNNYKCELEVWGSRGCLTTGRVLTAPAGFVPTATIRKGNDETVIDLPADDAFLKSIDHFVKCIQNEDERKKNYFVILKQAEMVDSFRDKAGIC